MHNLFIGKNSFSYLFQLLIISVVLILSPFSFAKDRIQYHVQGADGSTLKTINEQGIVTQSYQYAPFGQQFQLRKPANLKNPKAFIGGVQDATDLVYLQQRHYNPVLGRFYQPDPITFTSGGHGQTNRYQYGWNDTYSFKDSSGLNPEFLMVTDPRAYYELRAMEFGYDINTFDGMDATAKAVQKEAFYELLGWGIGYGLGRVSTSIYTKAFSKTFDLKPVPLSFDASKNIWKSPAGLEYGLGSRDGNRILHVLQHAASDPNKATHTVFNVNRNQVLSLVDSAWMKRGSPLANDPGAYVVPMGRVIGTQGESSIKIIVRPNTAKVITAYPVR